MKRIVLLALFLAAGAAKADDLPCDCNPACERRADPTAGVVYDEGDPDHQHWYEARFWAGSCPDELGWSCWSGPSWYEAMEIVLAKGSAEDRPELCQRLYAVGAAMGFEWARQNDVRSIHTKDLSRWRDDLLDGDDPAIAITELEARVAARLK